MSKHLVTTTKIKGAEVRTNAFISSANEVISSIDVEVRRPECVSTTTIWLDADDTRALIANLEQHLHNIKAAEMELLANTAKAA